jgi:hypothetical protein
MTTIIDTVAIQNCLDQNIFYEFWFRLPSEFLLLIRILLNGIVPALVQSIVPHFFPSFS